MKNRYKLLILTNLIPPYWLPILEHFQKTIGELRIFLSTHMEPSRHWKPQWGDLSVSVQRCLSFKKSWRHEQGFSEDVFVHIPYDTLPLLWHEQPDVVVTAQLGFRTMQAVLYKKLRPQARLIIWTGLSEHTEKGRSTLRTYLRSWLLRHADAVLVDGKSGVRYLMTLGVPQSKIFLLYHTIELKEFLRSPLRRDPSSARRLVYFGRLVQLKGLLPFLRILTSWLQDHPDSSCELWLVGDGPVRQELQQFPIPRSLSLRFLGNVEYDQLPGVYAQGGILAFPSLSDEWGVVVNEALASGVPVLGSLYSQAVEELVTDGVHGWTFRPDHSEEVYNAIDRALTVPIDQLDEMRRACRQEILGINVESGVQALLRAVEFTNPSARHGANSGEGALSQEDEHSTKDEVPVS
jgi:glycosyltransferase involved in cell wall biosynthesis